MNHHDIGTSIDRSERARYRVLTSVASSHDPQPFAIIFQVRRRVGGKIGRQGHDNLVDVRVREKDGHASLEDRTTCDRQQLLRDGAAKPETASAGGDDRRNEHL